MCPGKIQDQDLKSVAELVAAGATAASLPNDTKVYVTANSINKTLNQAITDGDIGSSGLNYVAMPASTGTSITGWATYADAAGTAPVDGTGGSPASTFTTSTDSSIVGASNFIWTKSAANRQGEGFSYDFTIDQGYQSKPFTISFLYKIASGTFADADMTCWVYDKTNSVLIQPSAYTIQNIVGVFQKKCEFQTSSSSTSYRLIVHTSSTSASAYTLRFDSFSVSPNTYNAGAVVTDWVAYTPTYTGFGTVTSSEMQSRRVGSSLEIRGSFTTGTTTATEARLSLGFGGINGNVTAAATDKIPSLALVGYLQKAGTATNQYGILIEPSVGYVTFALMSGSVNGVTKVNGDTYSSSTKHSFFASVPILGWSTTQVLSSDTDTRVVAASYYASAATQTPGANAQINYDTKIIDTHGAVTTGAGAWKFTAPVSGTYSIAETTNYASGTSGYVRLYKNGTPYTYLHLFSSTFAVAPGSTLINLIAGDYIDVRPDSGGVVAGQGLPYSTKIDIQRISGPAQIAASEKIYLQYTGNAGTALTADVTNIDFTTKVVDSHGAWNGTTFTAPRPGWYNVLASTIITSATNANMFIWINGVKKFNTNLSVSTQTHSHSGGAYLNAGDTLTIRSDTNCTLSNSATAHWISITSQGN